MRFREIFSPRRCRFCKRKKDQAEREQVERASVCPTDQCAFQAHITAAVREAWKAELLSFKLSTEDVLEGETITISWQTKNCASASITDYGEVAVSGTVTLEATPRMRQIELNLVDLFGEVFSHTRSLRIRRKPTIQALTYNDRVLTGEQSPIRFKPTNAKKVLLRDLSGSAATRDLTNEEFFTTERALRHRQGRWRGPAGNKHPRVRAAAHRSLPGGCRRDSRHVARQLFL